MEGSGSERGRREVKKIREVKGRKMEIESVRD
jgi:hypothetical protein